MTSARRALPFLISISLFAQTKELILREYQAFLSIPNVAADPAGLDRNAQWIIDAFGRRGVAMRRLEAKGVPAAVYGEIVTPGAMRTVVFYSHYDGQPVDKSQWKTAPFDPVLVGKVDDPEARLYARSASDSKAPIMAMLAALDEIKAKSLALHQNVKFFFEGEEEAGSTHIAQILMPNKAMLRGDVWLICDGPVHQSRKQQIVFGARGDRHVEITVYGPHRELHSGHYGNWAPNPALMLSHLLASMKEEDGRVLVAGFYDGIVPLSETEKRAVAEAPLIDAELRDELWLGAQENPGKKIEEVVNLPALTIRGLSSSHTGPMASNVVPATAAASLDIRLVKGVDHQKTYERIVAHIRKQGYFVVTHEPTKAEMTAHPKVARVMSADGYNAERISMDLPISKLVIGAVEAAMGPVVKLPTMGGSVPNGTIADALGVPTILVPMANHDNSQHSSNENLRLKNLWDGITLMRSLIAMN